MKNNKYTVSITTYFRRFDDWFKPLLSEIKRQRPNVEVIVSVNGELQEEFYEDFRKNILLFLSEYPNVFPVFYPKFRSMSKMWNTNIILSSEQTCLLLEDDIGLDTGFFDEYEKVLSTFESQKCKSFLINGSYAALSVDKLEMIKVGWFDERFLGLGAEDGEFTNRYQKITGGHIDMYRVRIPSCKNTIEFEKLAKLIQEEPRLGQCDEFGRYSKFNMDIHQDIYKTQNMFVQYPYESFYLQYKHLV